MKNLILAIVFLSIQTAVAQAPSVEWKKTFGGTSHDYATCVQQTSDGGYVVAGRSGSTDGDVTGNHGSRDYWIVKLDSESNITWQKSFGGSNYDSANAIRQTSDGGYIVAGITYSNDFDVTNFHGNYDIWIIKLDPAGDLVWEKTLGGSEAENARSIEEVDGGGYIVVGDTNSNDGDVSELHQSTDYWVVKLNSLGSVEWQRTLGGTSNDFANSVCLTNDGGFAVIGITQSNNGDVTINHGTDDCWVVKLSSTGAIQWEKSFGGSVSDFGNSIKQTFDGGYVLVGSTQSGDGDAQGNHGSGDFWIIKLDENGLPQWHRTFGGTDNEGATDVYQTTNGSYVLAGLSRSSNGDVSENNGSDDWWIINVDENGNLLWEKVLGGSSSDWCNYVEQTVDGGFVLTGFTQSSDGDIENNHGDIDYWVVKLSQSDLKTKNYSYSKESLSLYPNPATESINVILDIPSSITIFDQVGKILYNNTVEDNRHILKIDFLSAGLYTLKTKDGKMIKFLKL